MATKTKIDFSDYGTIEKLARRFYRLWQRNLKRDVTDCSEEAESESLERAKIRNQIKSLATQDIGFDIIDSLEDSLAWCTIACYDRDEYDFKLGVLTGLGFRRFACLVFNSELDTFLYRAHQYKWDCIRTDYHMATVTKVFLHRALETDN